MGEGRGGHRREPARARGEESDGGGKRSGASWRGAARASGRGRGRGEGVTGRASHFSLKPRLRKCA